MYLKNLAIVNFKNFEQAELSFSPKINCFIGNNGVGKTNLLDAVFYLSFCKSYFNPIDSQNIRHENDFFVLQGTYQRQESIENIYCGMKRNNKKQFKRNKREYEKLSEHIGLLPLVMISPADIRLILEGSEERRKYMNFVISQYDKQYLNNAIKYNKALIQRNALLKQFDHGKKFDSDALDIWTEKLIQLGKEIYRKRVEFIDTLQTVFQKYYDFISGRRESVRLIYDSQFHEAEPEALYEKALQKDRILQYSTVGIHKDDLQLELNSHPIKKEGSQGQQKTYLMALKLAQYDFLNREDNSQPLLLLDDIFDKFDSKRVAQIIKLVSENHFGQIFITDTNRERLMRILSEISIDFKIFEITDSGEIRE